MDKYIKKSFKIENTDLVQLNENEVLFYFCKFNEYDLHKDRILNGCFDSIDINNVKYYLNHDTNKPIGTVLNILSDNEGYLAHCKIIDNSLISGVKDMYLNGIIKEHSFYAIFKDYEKNDFGGYDLKKGVLMEVSALTEWAANPNTELVAIKNLNNEKNINFANNNNNDMKNNELELQKTINDMKQELEVTKAKQEEVQALNSKIEDILNNLNNLQQTVFDLSNTVSSFEITDSESKNEDVILDEMQYEASKNKKKKKKLPYSLDVNKIQRVKVNPKAVKKSLTISGTASVNITDGGLQNTIFGNNSLVDLMNIIEANSIDVVYSLVGSVATANNQGQDCYVSNPTNINVQKYQVHLDRLTARTTYCQSEMMSVNQDDFLSEIQFILQKEIKDTLSNYIYLQFTSFGLVQTSVPSWTALAGSVPSPTLIDILNIHTNDIYQLTNGRVDSEIVMVVNPIDYSRLRTDKTLENYVIQPEQFNVFKDRRVPSGSYVVFPRDFFKLFMYGDGEIQTALDGLRPYDGIVHTWLTFYAHLALRAENANTVIYGNIANALSNY